MRLQAKSILWAVLSIASGATPLAHGQIMLSGNENKIDLTGGGQQVLTGVAPDSLTMLDFSKFPPTVVNIENVPNTVLGPPSNIAISPDGKVAIVANSAKIDPPGSTKWVPESYAHIVDLYSRPPQVVGKVQTELQPSGASFTPDGRFVLIANRASGTISVLSVEGVKVTPSQTVKVCEPLESVSDVAISPDGKMALASVQKAGYLAVLAIDKDGKVTATGRKISVFGQPYRCVISPDGAFGFTAGGGYGNGTDMDAVSVIDLKAEKPHTVDYVPIGVSPESIEISPDGKTLAAVVIEGSNQPAGNPNHGDTGALVILSRHDHTYIKTQRIPVGRIPEGVAFTSDGHYLVVQCHPDRQLWIFEVKNGFVIDTQKRISVPGMPSSLRASPARH